VQIRLLDGQIEYFTVRPVLEDRRTLTEPDDRSLMVRVEIPVEVHEVLPDLDDVQDILARREPEPNVGGTSARNG
jgi:hypothetical protein